jgi:hypothetical protein
MSEACCGRDHCDCCGSTSFTSATFKGGRLICAACWREIERSKGGMPSKQQALPLAQAAQPRAPRVGKPEPERWGDHVQLDSGCCDLDDGGSRG